MVQALLTFSLLVDFRLFFVPTSLPKYKALEAKGAATSYKNISLSDLLNNITLIATLRILAVMCIGVYIIHFLYKDT